MKVFLGLIASLSVVFASVELASSAASAVTEEDFFSRDWFKCTMIGTGKNVMKDGSLITTHNNDCAECDIRITHVPARDWPAGSQRPIYDPRAAYPRYVEDPEMNIHGPDYLSDRVDRSIFNWTVREPMTYIDQVAHTYAYTLGTYALQNEKQVSIGESTCAAVWFTKPLSLGGKAAIHMNVLTELGLERCDTARCAVQTMGDLAVQHGFFGEASDGDEDTAKKEAGEALIVSDTTETFMFHILPDDTGTSAVWVAQRVPDDHITVCANSFVITEIDVSDTTNFLASDNIFEVAERNKLWSASSGEPFRFNQVYGGSYETMGYMSTRRAWRVFTLAAPTLPLSPYTDAWGTFGYGKDGKEPYPFSVKPDKLLALTDIMRMNRDQYEGTEFDLTKSLDAGPFGDPMRYNPIGALTDPVNGVTKDEWLHGGGLGAGRAISLWRTAYSSITQSRPGLPDEIGAVTWIAQYAPHHSSFVPVYAAAESAPSSVNTGTQYKLDKDANYWVHSATSNYLSKWYSYTIDSVVALQTSIDSAIFTKQAEMEAKALKVYEKHHRHRRLSHTVTDDADEEVATYLQEFHEWAATYARDSWWTFFYESLANFRDCYRITDPHNELFQKSWKSMSVPRWWLEQVGYWGELGAKSPFRNAAVEVHPINIPTLNSEKEYEKEYPERMDRVMNLVDVSGKPGAVDLSTGKFATTDTDDAAQVTTSSTSLGLMIVLFLVGAAAGAAAVYLFMVKGRQAYLPIN